MRWHCHSDRCAASALREICWDDWAFKSDVVSGLEKRDGDFTQQFGVIYFNASTAHLLFVCAVLLF